MSSSWWQWASALSTLAMVAALPVVSAHATADPDPGVCEVSVTLVNACRPWVGASANKYPQVAQGLRAQTEYHEQRIGRQLDLVHAYNGTSATGLSADQVYFASRPDTTLYLNWKPASRWSDATGANSTVNARIDANVASIKSLGDSKIFLTIHHEPENDVSGGATGCTVNSPGTAGTPAEYREMWSYVRGRFDALEVTNVVWAVTFMSYQPYNCMIDDLYPGNDLVDWVFFDNYGSGTNDSFEENVGRMYDFLSSTSDAEHDYNAKPWGIAEWNISRGSLTPQQTYDYYDEAATLLRTGRFPKLKAYMIWDSVDADGDENRIMYQPGGVVDPLRQEHYAAFAHTSLFNVTAPDILPPTAPIMDGVAIEDGAAHVTWLAATDDVGVAKYEVFRDGSSIGSTRGTTFGDPDISEGSTYGYSVRAIDLSQNASELSAVASVTVGDLTAPTAPGAPSGVANPDDSVTLTWAESTDDTAVDHYEVWRGDSFLTDSPGPAVTDSDTAQGRSYAYRVYATDLAGNRSTASPTTTVFVPDRDAPTAPGSLVATSPKSRTVWLTWTGSSDNVAVAGYYVFRDSLLIATLPSTARSRTVTGLTSRRFYEFSVRSFDAAGNVSPLSNVAGVRVR